MSILAVSGDIDGISAVTTKDAGRTRCGQGDGVITVVAVDGVNSGTAAAIDVVSVAAAVDQIAAGTACDGVGTCIAVELGGCSCNSVSVMTSSPSPP